MRFCQSIFLLLAFLTFTNVCLSGTVDVEIQIESDSLDDLNFGESGNFSITLTNFGPDVAGGMSQLDRPVEAIAIIEFEQSGSPLNFIQNNSIPQDCDFLISFAEPVPPNPLVVGFSFYFPPIPVGHSITCYGTFFALFNSGTRTVEWQVFPGQDTDSDESNNIQAMVFGVPPRPVPLSGFTLFFIIFTMLIFGLFNVRKLSDLPPNFTPRDE